MDEVEFELIGGALKSFTLLSGLKTSITSDTSAKIPKTEKSA
jgi:hypothetical protein